MKQKKLRKLPELYTYQDRGKDDDSHFQVDKTDIVVNSSCHFNGRLKSIVHLQNICVLKLLRFLRNSLISELFSSS